jgi:hypothetical protein
LNQSLADVVIQPLLEALFSAGEPSQKSSRIPSAFALNISPDPTVAVTSGLNLASTPRFARGSRC